jgi:hypothetical protein
MTKILFAIISFLCYTTLTFCADTLRIKNNDVIVKAIKINYSVNVDGKLDEECWLNGDGLKIYSERACTGLSLLKNNPENSLR